MFGCLSGLGQCPLQRVSQFMCLKEEPEMNALLHVPTSCLDDMAAPHGLQPREVCLSSDVVSHVSKTAANVKIMEKGIHLKTENEFCKLYV